MSHLTGKKILILATDGFEQSELEVPRDRLKAHGAEVVIAAPSKTKTAGEITGWKDGNWGSPVKVDRTLDDVSAADFDAIVLPGGVMNPDKLRMEEKAIDLIRAFYDDGKVVAAVCHGPWLLAEAGLLVGRNVTSYKSIRTDLENAGAHWEDAAVVTDNGLITSRNPGDLEAFSEKITEEIREGGHDRTALRLREGVKA